MKKVADKVDNAASEVKIEDFVEAVKKEFSQRGIEVGNNWTIRGSEDYLAFTYSNPAINEEFMYTMQANMNTDL